MRDEAKFESALKRWHDAASDAVVSREAYRKKWAVMYNASQGKTADARKNEADAATSDERLHRDIQEVDAQTAMHRMLFLRGPEVIVSRGEE